MNFELQSLNLSAAAKVRCPAFLVLVSDEFRGGNDALSGLIARARKSGDFKTEAGCVLNSFGAEGVGAERVCLLGVGRGGPAQVRKAIQGVAAALRATPARALTVLFAQQASAEAVCAATMALAQAAYRYSATKSTSAKTDPGGLDMVTIGVADAEAVRAEFLQAVGMVPGVELAREWANRPGNHATPAMLADAARKLAKGARMHCEVLGPKEVRKLGMGAFEAIARGSAEELRFIVLRYNGASKDAAPVVLVGKGITFDTGGISIKPAAEMDEMKFDMSGAASVLGVFRSLAELKPSVNVVGLIPACENMPDGRAIKPGDVVTSMSGQTIEILNTDAEGRLVLCDALTYAERFKPSAVIDIATLTGACVIALGGVRSGLFSNNEALAAALQAAGDRALDPCWRMPLDEDYAEGLKTNFADVANVAGRPAGAVTAAKFLQRFVGDAPWAHLDIAGTAWKGAAAKGGTGRPVALLLEYLLGQAEKSSAPEGGKPKKSTAEKPRKKTGPRVHS